MHLSPLGNYVIVKPAEVEEKTPTGIILAQSAQELPERGVVLAIGPGRLMKDGTRYEFDFVIGDTVLFKKYGGMEVKEEGEKYLLLDADGILAVVR